MSRAAAADEAQPHRERRLPSPPPFGRT
jgi:hypothetical protein